ncbi:MAG TPA: ATP-binding protein [Acetobacteraceae bacterium]|nr:ATP-binding protein [Acetobacteraceae bacterium]
MSLRLRMILLAGVCILPSVLLLASTQWQLRQARAAEVRREIAELASSEANEIATIIGGARQFLGALEHSPAVLQRNAPLCSAWLARLRHDNPIYASIRADDLSGRAFCSSDPGRAAFDGDEPYFQEVLRRRGFAVGTEAVSPLTHEPELPLARIVVDDEGSPADVLVVELDLSWLQQDLAARLPPDASLTLLDRNGHALLHAAGSRQPPTGSPDQIVSRAQVGDGGTGLEVIAARPRLSAFAALDRTTRDGMVFIVLGLLLACLGAAWIGRRFIQAPINALLTATERLRNGDYTARAHPAADASELAQLGSGLNALAGDLEQRKRAQADAEARLRQLAATLEQRVELRTRELAEANERLAAEAEQRQRTQAELAQMQKLDAIGKLTGGIAHDFNNLLAAVLGSLEMVLPRVDDARLKRLLNVATQAAQRGAKLTSHLLAFSRKQDLVLRPVDVNAVITGMDDLLSRTLGKLVRLDFDLSDELWPATGDPVQLEVGLLNLAINARDAMPEGGTLAFRTRNVHVAEGPHAGVTLPSGDYAMVAVIDSGEGMPDSVLAKVFEPFFTTKGPGKGTGLGLSMIYGFARQAGGTVTIDSTPGKGTAVSLYLPRAREQAEADPVRPAEAQSASRRLHVLLVDDDSMVRETTREMLLMSGHTVVEAATPEAALALLRDGEQFNLLVADFSMPGMTGVQLAERAHELRPQLPVLIITGFAEADGLQPTARVWPVLRKPFYAADLADAVRASVAASSAPD